METNLLKWHHYSHIRTVSYSFHSSTVFLGGFHCHSQLCTYLLFCFYFVHVYIGLTMWTNKVIIECNVTKVLASLLCWSSTLDDYRMFGKWYFVTKIVLTYWEKKLFYWSRKTFEIRGRRPRIFKIFEITRTFYSNSERTIQFLKQKRKFCTTSKTDCHLSRQKIREITAGHLFVPGTRPKSLILPYVRIVLTFHCLNKLF